MQIIQCCGKYRMVKDRFRGMEFYIIQTNSGIGESPCFVKDFLYRIDADREFHKLIGI